MPCKEKGATSRTDATEMNDDILIALKAVIDPELGINIVDLGLVYHTDRNTNGIYVALTMTTPACPLGEMMSEEVMRVLRKRFPDAPAVQVEIVWDPPWSPELMSEEARLKLGTT
jgi:metal-sulfur cluster biosynthetic enzyme